MYWPSGDQEGLFTSRFDSSEIWRRFDPSGSISQMLVAPSLSEMKAMAEPFGLNRGCMSKDCPDEMRAAVPPAIGIV